MDPPRGSLWGAIVLVSSSKTTDNWVPKWGGAKCYGPSWGLESAPSEGQWCLYNQTKSMTPRYQGGAEQNDMAPPGATLHVFVCFVFISQTCEAHGVLTSILWISRVSVGPKVVFQFAFPVCFPAFPDWLAVTRNCKEHSNYTLFEG